MSSPHPQKLVMKSGDLYSEISTSNVDEALHRAPGRWGVGRLVPLTLAFWAVLDIVPRFGPLEWLQLDPVQIAHRAPGRYSPFHANLQLKGPYVGAEARLANVPPQEFRDPVVFTTDSRGFRFSPFAAKEPATVMVFGGFSFTFGSALSDGETFPSRLGSILGVRAYNAGRFQQDPETNEELDWLLDQLHRTVKTAVYIYADAAPDKPDRPRSEAPEPWTDRMQSYARRYTRGWRLVSPLEILSIRFHRALIDGHFLPSEANDKVAVTHLPNGSRVLLWINEIEAWDAPPLSTASGQADFLASWRDTLKRRGIDMSVLLVPTKTEVYAPTLLQREPATKQSFLNVFELELKRRAVPVLNGLKELRRSAASDIRDGNLSFYRDDSHWNPRGVSILAEETASLLRENGWQPPPGRVSSRVKLLSSSVSE